jgi:gentisate 1,2-dioxygenase
MLLNPGLEGAAATTSTLFAGMQLILPARIAGPIALASSAEDYR